MISEMKFTNDVTIYKHNFKEGKIIFTYNIEEIQVCCVFKVYTIYP